MEGDVSQIGSTKRKLSDESSNGDGKGKKPRLQVTIPRLQLSQEQLERLRKISLKHQKAPLIVNKEDDKENVATVNASASSTVSTTETVSTETTTIEKEPVTTVEESPTRHRLTDLLDGPSLGPYQDSAAHAYEENVTSINCTGGGQLDNGKGLLGPVTAEENLSCSEDLLSSLNGLSPSVHEEDSMTVPCHPDVVSKTCMQVEMGCTQTSSDDGSQAADVVTASVQDNEEDSMTVPCHPDVVSKTCMQVEMGCTQTSSDDGSQAVDVVTASVQDKEDDYKTNQRLQPTSVEEVPNAPEEGNEAGSCDVLGQLSNDARPDEKEAESGNAEEGSGMISMSAEAHVEDSIIDYASHYDTLEAMNTLLTKFTEEKRARTELEELVSHLEVKNKELVSACETLKGLVNDLLPSPKIKNETVSRGIQINMDLSLRRGRTVDRATSPLRRIREPSPDLTIVSFSTGCQTVDLSNEVTSTACQTDPPVDARLQAKCTTQSAVPVRVQGIVIPSVQGRVPVEVPNYTQASNPVQMPYSQTPPPFQQQSAKVTVSQPLGIQSQQGHANRQMLANTMQTTGYNNIAGPHAATRNPHDVRISRPTGAALYAQGPQNHLIPMPSLTTTQMSGNQTLVGSNPGVYTGGYDTLAAQQATRQDTLNQSTGQRLNLNTAALSPLFTQNQLLAHSSASLSHQTLSSVQSASQNSRPAQFVGAQQYSTQQRTTPTSSMQVSTNARSRIQDVMLHLVNGMRRQITTTATQSLGNPQQPVGASLPRRMVYNQVTTPQHKKGLPLQHQASPPLGSQVQQHTSLRNSQQSLGTFPQRRVGSNQVAAPQQSGVLHIQHQVSQPEASQAHLHAQPNSASVQQKNVITLIEQQSDHTLSSSRTSNTDDLANRLLENGLERRARSHVEALSLYNEVQLVYNELQRSSRENTPRQKQSNTTQEPRSLYDELRQVLASKNTPPSNQQPPDAVHCTNSLSSLSEQSRMHCHTSANHLPSHVSSGQSLSKDTQKHLVHFSQEAVSNIPVSASPGNANRSSLLDSSVVRQIDDKDQNSPRQDTLCRLSIDNDPYKVPPKTPSGALEDVVKKLLTLQNEIARTENVSGTGHVSLNSLAESTGGTSKAANTTKSQESAQTEVSESTASSERDPNDESLQHYTRNTEHNSAETISLNQETDTQRRIKDQDNNDSCSSGNQDKPTKGTSVSPSSHNVLNTHFDEMEAENEPASSVPEGNKIEHFPATEGEEQDSAGCEEQNNIVSDRQDSSSPCSSGLAEGTENKDEQDSDAENNSSQDIYVGLMSPIIPRMAAARRVRSHSDVHTAKDLCDVDTSTSSIDVPSQNVNSDDHNMEDDPEPNQSSDDREQILKDILQEGATACPTVPFADVHCTQQERGSDTASNSEQENAVNDKERVLVSSGDTMEKMELEEDMQVSSTGSIVTALSNAQQAACNAKIQEKPETNLPEEQLSTGLSHGQRDLPAPVPALNSNVKLEASDGPCMGGVAQVNNKVDKDEQYQKHQLNPKAIPKQTFVCLNSTLQETPIPGYMDETKKASLALPLPSSLLKENIDEKRVCRVSVDSKTNVELNKKNTAINNEPSPLNTSPLPVPRVAVRITNGNIVIMWDLPPDNRITDISHFEIYVYGTFGRLGQNQTCRWYKVGGIKAMPLPMACAIRQTIQKNVLYPFIVRAVGNNGLPGLFSKPCCVTY